MKNGYVDHEQLTVWQKKKTAMASQEAHHGISIYVGTSLVSTRFFLIVVAT
jgi:hypothetical protein